MIIHDWLDSYGYQIFAYDNRGNELPFILFDRNNKRLSQKEADEVGYGNYYKYKKIYKRGYSYISVIKKGDINPLFNDFEDYLNAYDIYEDGDEESFTNFLQETDYKIYDLKEVIDNLEEDGEDVSKAREAYNSLYSKEGILENIQGYERRFNLRPKDLREEGLEIVISSRVKDIVSMSTGRGWTSCMDKRKANMSGSVNYSYHLIEDVRYGTIMAYLITKKEANLLLEDNKRMIDEAIGRYAIKPYFNEDDEDQQNYEDVLYIREPVMYGGDGSSNYSFVAKIVDDFLDSKQDTKQGIFYFHSELYRDHSHDRIVKMRKDLENILPERHYKNVQYYNISLLYRPDYYFDNFILDAISSGKIEYESSIDIKNDKKTNESIIFRSGKAERIIWEYGTWMGRRFDKSQFIKGIWKDGTAYDSDFGPDINVKMSSQNSIYKDVIIEKGDFYECNVKATVNKGMVRFYNTKFEGVWNGYLFKNSVFVDGIWNSGEWENSEWLNGKWIKGKIYVDHLNRSIDSIINPHEFFEKINDKMSLDEVKNIAQGHGNKEEDLFSTKLEKYNSLINYRYNKEIDVFLTLRRIGFVDDIINGNIVIQDSLIDTQDKQGYKVLTWKRGIWKKGVFKFVKWEDGTWLDGKWSGEEWVKGDIKIPFLGTIVQSKLNPKELFSKINKEMTLEEVEKIAMGHN